MKDRGCSRLATSVGLSFGLSRSLSLGLSLVLSLSWLLSPVQAEKMALVSPDESLKSNFQITRGMNWFRNLEEAQKAAREQKKLVFWVHMLGSMDGAT